METPLPSRRRPNLALAAGLLALLLLIVLVAALTQRADPAPSLPAAAGGSVAFDIPPEVAGHEAEWPLANHDYANTRAAAGSSISARASSAGRSIRTSRMKAMRPCSTSAVQPSPT